MTGQTDMDDARLDALLTRAASRDVDTGVPAGLSARVLADFDAVGSRLGVLARLRAVLARAGDVVWPGAPAWQPAGVLALALLAGVFVGEILPADNANGASSALAMDGVPNLAEDF